MFQRQRSIWQIDDRDFLYPKRWGRKPRAIAGLDPRLLGMKAPLRHFFFASSNLSIGNYDGIETDSLNPIGDEVHACAVVRLICIAGRVNEEARLGFVVPLRVAPGDALLIALIEDDVAVCDYLIRGVINGYFVGLQSVRPDARVDIPFTNRDAGLFRT